MGERGAIRKPIEEPEGDGVLMEGACEEEAGDIPRPRIRIGS